MKGRAGRHKTSANVVRTHVDAGTVRVTGVKEKRSLCQVLLSELFFATQCNPEPYRATAEKKKSSDASVAAVQFLHECVLFFKSKLCTKVVPQAVRSQHSTVGTVGTDFCLVHLT